MIAPHHIEILMAYLVSMLNKLSDNVLKVHVGKYLPKLFVLSPLKTISGGSQISAGLKLVPGV